MAIASAEEALFKRWAPNRKGFVRDGVADEQYYIASKPSLLFLLKEVNDPNPGGGGWDLREFLCKGAQWQTWNNVTRWVQGIRSLPAELSWAEVSTVTHEQRSKALCGIAAMNLKKSPGSETTVVPSFWQAAKEDAPFLREQFSIYDAEITVCCGSVVTDAFKAFLEPDDAQGWQETKRGVEFLEHGDGRYVVAYSHPQAWVANNLLYYGLVDAVREILHE